VLLAINTMNFFDRQILPAVQEKLPKEWELNDFKLGLLGTGFILLYALVGLPLGRWADVGHRRWLLAGGVALWSLMTLGSGFAWGFWSLLVLRLGVGVGEAACAPVASSLLGDLVPAAWRARAMSFFMLGLPLGLALSFAVSATIAQHHSWQAACYVAGVPGLFLAGLVLLIADPRTGSKPLLTSASQIQNSPAFFAVVREVLRKPTMWWLILSGAIHNFNMYALGTFLASFLKRYHQVSLQEAGWISGLVYGCGAVGIFLAGWIGDMAFRRSVAGRLHVAWIGLAAAIPCLGLALLVPAGEAWLCAACLLPACMLLYTYYGTVYATIQDINAPSLRGMAMAIYFCGMYLLGAFLGPAVTGWISDFFAQRAAAAAGSAVVTDLHKAIGLHDAMYLIPALNLPLTAVLLAATWTVKRDCRGPSSGKETSSRGEKT
jgi:MFS family permease